MRNIFTKLKVKINAITSCKRRANIFICPILPPCSVDLQKPINYFNNLIRSELVEKFYQCNMLNVSELVDTSDLLDVQFSRGDKLHLNKRGVSKLATCIKSSIFLRYNGGRGPKYSSVLSDRGKHGQATPKART